MPSTEDTVWYLSSCSRKYDSKEPSCHRISWFEAPNPQIPMYILGQYLCIRKLHSAIASHAFGVINHHPA